MRTTTGRLGVPALPRARRSSRLEGSVEGSGEVPDAPPVPPIWVVQNLTPRPIWVEHEGRVFTLGPLEERLWPQPGGPAPAVPGPPWVAFPGLERLVDRHQLDVRTPPAVAAAHRRGVLRRWTSYNAVMMLVIAIGVLLPAGALYLATDLHEIVSLGRGGIAVDTSRPLVLIGRLMQLTFIAVATLLPALMYFQFDAERLGTLRDRWMQNVFRLDPTVTTTCDVTAKYGRQLEEAYGSPDDGRGRLTRGRRSPIIFATLVLAFGWLLILLKAGESIDGRPEITFVSLLDPSPSLVTYAFLGAYFFGLQLVWQGYLRADLRPKTYTTITVRVLIVVVLAWLMDATLGFGQSPEWLYLLAFTAGFVPDSVLHLIWERVGPGMSVWVDAGRRQPLTELEGVDLYERTRLSEEGITSVEALAHHDLLDLFFKTRIPAARLVDWTDQAVLVMYLGAADPALREALRSVGVRTASDLVDLTRRRPDGFERLLEAVRPTLPEAERPTLRQRLTLIATALDHSEWIGRIENWRRSDLIEAIPGHRRYIGPTGDLHPGDPRSGTSITL